MITLDTQRIVDFQERRLRIITTSIGRGKAQDDINQLDSDISLMYDVYGPRKPRSFERMGDT